MEQTTSDMDKDYCFDFTYYTVQELYDSNCSQIPKENGIYVVDVPEGFCVEFTPTTTAYAKYKIYTVEELQEKYEQSDKKRLYIGKAERAGGLRARLQEYVKYGKQENERHQGGKAIWQIANSGNLLIGYSVCDNPGELEGKMLRSYKKVHSVLPVANRRCEKGK